MNGSKIIEKSKSENFPVASVLMPARVRRGVMAFYSFARSADDIADAVEIQAEEKLASLRAVDAAVANDAGDIPPWAEAYMRLIRAGELDNRHGRALLSAFLQDVEKSRYDSWEELIDYCNRSAAPVGRAVLGLHRQWNADIAASDTLCNVLQILNHLQDLNEDFIERDRVYFPLEWFDNVADLSSDKSNANIRSVINHALDEVDTMLVQSATLPSTLSSKRLRAEIATIWHIADALSKKLRFEDPLAKRVKLSKGDYLKACVKGLWTALISTRHIVDAAEVTSSSGSSFFRPLLSLSKDKQQAMFALYAFCRVVDDAVDEAETPQEAAQNLTFWEQEIARLYSQDIQDYPTSGVTRALLPWVKKCGLERQYFDEILAGMRMDQRGMLIPSQAEFTTYCYRVAACVGHVSVAIFGEDNPTGHRFADALGQGLQTINIMRDVYEDATLGRIYLPRELLEKHGASAITVQDILDVNPTYNTPLQAVLKDMGKQAESHMDTAFSLLNDTNRTNMKPALAMAKVYGVYLEKIRQADYTVTAKRVRLSKWEKLRLLVG